jgi:CheY-like chemotaxis protein
MFWVFLRTQQKAPSSPEVFSTMSRVLLADDSESIRKALHDVIRREGWTVCGEASNGEEAVAMARELAPDLVVLDFLMPTMNGLAAAERILEANPQLPIILSRCTRISF